ncbi:glycoside hydrolase family 95 protein [Luteolibacter flavescens]|uniref:Glycoside hydrolase family 95 protein n=1 Tax=Luteolibacter flavescens TaxID=1859460 RepID=A0ABT3FS18_9BACT|nr:glycoside hydrolase family 95 protein [Luteolibacter flavescens]MCW1886094.1 glycoside hydrolase family 95 protein [Luteolibacter flavescens]
MRWTLVLPLICHFATAGELAFPSPAASVEQAFPLGNGSLFTRLNGDTKREVYPLWTEVAKTGEAADEKAPSLGFTGTTRAELTFDWLNAEGEVTGYKRRLDLKDGLSVVTFKRGGVGFTWTTFVSKPDDLMVLHLRTDKPGALSFRVQLSAKDQQAKVEDRRVLTLQAGDFSARAWIYPMESEVTPGENQITVMGEGEALIILAASDDPKDIAHLPDRLKKLAGEDHPDTFALWSGLLERQDKSYREANKAADLAGHLEAIRK